MSSLKVLLLKYGRKRFFDGFEIGCRAFTVLSYEHWKLFCIDWRYGENVYSPALNRIYGIHRSIFRNFKVFCDDWRYGQAKTFICHI